MKSVVICGSRRFREEIWKFADRLEEMGVSVFRPFLTEFNFGKMEKDIRYMVASGLTLHHFESIRRADVCFIYNRDGYIGSSVTLEMGVAVGCSKPIYALEDDEEEYARRILFDGKAETPEELVRFLR